LSRDLRIAVVGKNPLRAAIIEEGLHAAGPMSVERIDDTAELVDHIRAIDPDVILIDLESPSRDVLEQMLKVSRSVARPVAMFVDRSNAATIDAAIDAGVSADIVDGRRKDRVKPILGGRRSGLGSGFGLLPARRRGNERLVDAATGIGSQ
jgi:response regulator NasT